MSWQKIILHHTATSKAADVEEIRRYHVEERGWSDIGYHFLVDFRGHIFKGRPLDRPGAHAYGYNDVAIGVAAIGNFEVHRMPKAQMQGIIKLVRRLMEEYNISTDGVLMHRDVGETLCPGKYFPEGEILEGLKKKPGPFPDVPADHWAADAVAWCKEYGVMGGYPNGEFKGNNPPTRYELAAFGKALFDAIKKAAPGRKP